MLTVDNISKSFDSKQILRKISFHVGKGQIFGLLGPNGAGKTTTLRIVLSLLKPDSGSITFMNNTSHKLQKTKISAVLEHHGLFDNLTAYQNLLYYLNIYEIKVFNINGFIDNMLTKVSLREKKHSPVYKLSAGMKQRLALARAFIPNPSMIILDEPTKNLDPEGKEDIHSLLCKFKEENGISVLLASHDLFETQRICSCGAIINNGHIAKQLTGNDIRMHPTEMLKLYKNTIHGESAL